MNFICEKRKQKYHVADESCRGAPSGALRCKSAITSSSSRPPRRPRSRSSSSATASRRSPSVRPATMAVPAVRSGAPVKARPPPPGPRFRRHAPRKCRHAFATPAARSAARQNLSACPAPGDRGWYPASADVPSCPLTRRSSAPRSVGRTSPPTLVWREGLDDWRPLQNIAGLSDLLRPRRPPLGPPRPGAGPSANAAARISRPAVVTTTRRPRVSRPRPPRSRGHHGQTLPPPTSPRPQSTPRRRSRAHPASPPRARRPTAATFDAARAPEPPRPPSPPAPPSARASTPPVRHHLRAARGRHLRAARRHHLRALPVIASTRPSPSAPGGEPSILVQTPAAGSRRRGARRASLVVRREAPGGGLVLREAPRRRAPRQALRQARRPAAGPRGVPVESSPLLTPPSSPAAAPTARRRPAARAPRGAVAARPVALACRPSLARAAARPALTPAAAGDGIGPPVVAPARRPRRCCPWYWLMMAGVLVARPPRRALHRPDERPAPRGHPRPAAPAPAPVPRSRGPTRALSRGRAARGGAPPGAAVQQTAMALAPASPRADALLRGPPGFSPACAGGRRSPSVRPRGDVRHHRPARRRARPPRPLDVAQSPRPRFDARLRGRLGTVAAIGDGEAVDARHRLAGM